jgi:hypothetical protein
LGFFICEKKMPITETTSAASGLNAGVTGLSVVTIAASIGMVDVSVLLGAFAGSVVFVMSAKEYHWLTRIVYLLTSTVISYQSAPWTASLLSLSSLPVAAIVNGVLCIVVLNGLIEQGKLGGVLNTIIKLMSALKK